MNLDEKVFVNGFEPFGTNLSLYKLTLWGCLTCTQNPSSLRTFRSLLMTSVFRAMYAGSNATGRIGLEKIQNSKLT